MSQIFLTHSDGRTLWVPTHRAGPSETAPVSILTQVTNSELVRSFYLFDTPIQLCDDPRAAASVPNGKTANDVVAAVAAFRQRCASDEQFMINSRYNPLKTSAPPRPAAAPPQPGMQAGQLPMTLPGQQPLQIPLPGSMSQPNMMMGAAGMPPFGGFAPPPQGMPPYGARFPIPGGPMQPNPQGGMMPMAMGGPMMPPMMPMGGGGGRMGPYGGGMMGHHNNNFHGIHNPQHNFYNPQGPRFGTMHGGGGGGNSRFSNESNATTTTIDKPQPIDVPIEIPKDVDDLYHQSAGRLYLATMPGARITVWLRQHKPEPSNYQRYIHCKGGISLMMKASASDVQDSKPVELIDRQLCTHFLSHGFCTRHGCLHVHHNEAQLRHMIAAKHVLLQDTTKKDREKMVEEVVEKDRASSSRPKEDFHTRYAIVSALPPTFVSGTPENLLRGHDAINDPINKDTASLPQLVQGNSTRSGGAPSATGVDDRPPPAAQGQQTQLSTGGSTSSTTQQQHPPPPPPPPQRRVVGPIGVATDSDSDDDDDDDSAFDSDESSSSSNSDSSDSDDSDDSSGSESELSPEEAAAAEAKKQYKKKLRKLIEEMKSERDEVVQSQKKHRQRIVKDFQEELNEFKKAAKREQRRKKEEEREQQRKRKREEVVRVEVSEAQTEVVQPPPPTTTAADEAAGEAPQ